MRKFDDNLNYIKEDINKVEALVLKYNKQPLTEEDVNHYAELFGFNSDKYTFEEKRLLAMDRFLYWTMPAQ